MNNSEVNGARSLASIVAEMKEEIRDFAETRVYMLKTELREKAAQWKIAGPLAGIGIVLVGTAYLLFTAAAVSLVAVLIGDAFRWVLALIAVGVLWAIVGAMSLYAAKRRIQANRLVPEKTIEVLKADKVWLQKEARSQI
jgi:uncharacterized membrane protein YqjE